VHTLLYPTSHQTPTDQELELDDTNAVRAARRRTRSKLAELSRETREVPKYNRNTMSSKPKPSASAQTSGAARLLQRQLKEMSTAKDLPGISVGLLSEDNVFVWEVVLMINDDCKYYGGSLLPLPISIPHPEPQAAQPCPAFLDPRRRRPAPHKFG
jgi:hypothetical protein